MIYTAERCQMVLFFFKQKTAYELRISDRSSNVCSSYLNYGEQIVPGQLICIVQGTQFPLRYVVMAAIHDLDRWIKTGVEPPEAPRYQFNGSALARDQYANAEGGIRLPPIEVPVASYRSDICKLGGITIPFTENGRASCGERVCKYV